MTKKEISLQCCQIILFLTFAIFQDLHGRYLAEQMVQHPEREDCYIARLVVKKVSPADSRRYFLHVENAHGTDRYAVALNVKGT